MSKKHFCKGENNGFTLIELMAVIMIMVLLGLILVPIIKNVITLVRQNSWRESVNRLINATMHYREQYVIDNNNEFPFPVTFSCDGDYCKESEGGYLVISGEVPNSGTITMKKADDIYAYLVTNGKWCASGYKGNIEVQDSCIKLDHTPPVIISENSIRTSTTKNKAIVSFLPNMMEDPETGVIRYIIDIKKNGELVEEKVREDLDNRIITVFNNLEANTEYEIEISGVNGNNLKTTVYRTVKTTLSYNPIIAYDNYPIDSSNGYVRSQTIKVNFEEKEENNKHYIKTTRKGKVSETIAICGKGSIPSTCTEYITNMLDVDTWYQVDKNINIMYDVDTDEVDKLYMMSSDGERYYGISSSKIAKIDNVIPTLKIHNVSSKEDSIVIGYRYNESKTGLGGYTCKYGETNNYDKESVYVSNDNCVLKNLEPNKTYYYEICFKDSLGNNKCLDGKAKTQSTETFRITYDNDPVYTKNSYLYEHNIKIDTSMTGKKDVYYVKSDRNLGIRIDSLGECGTGNNPSTCSQVSTNNLEPNKWYQVIGDITLTYSEDSNEYGNLVVAKFDGKKYKAYVTASIAKMESTKPKAPVIQGGTGENWVTYAPTIYVVENGSAVTEVSHYEYLIMKDDTKPTASFAATGVTNYSVTISEPGIQYVYFRTVSKAGNKSEWSEPQKVLFDNEKPGKTVVKYKSGFSGEAWQNNIEIILSASDNVGISYYQIDIDGNGSVDFNTSENYIPAHGTNTKTARFRAVDNVGNIGEWSDSVIIKMETEEPKLLKTWVGDVTDKNAYVYAQVSDNIGLNSMSGDYVGHKSGVYCAVTTPSSGYKDFKWIPANFDNSSNAYKCDIDISKFKEYNVDYLVNIYVFDYAYNGGLYEQLSMSIPEQSAEE